MVWYSLIKSEPKRDLRPKRPHLTEMTTIPSLSDHSAHGTCFFGYLISSSERYPRKRDFTCDGTSLLILVWPDLVRIYEFLITFYIQGIAEYVRWGDVALLLRRVRLQLAAFPPLVFIFLCLRYFFFLLVSYIYFLLEFLKLLCILAILDLC